MFVVFLLGWVATRQIGLAMVTYSVAVKTPKFIHFEWNPAKQRYMTNTTYTIFVALLTLLLVLCTVWFCMAISVALRVVRGQGAEDTRSDSEEGDEEEEDELELETRNGDKPNGVANGNGSTRSRRTTPAKANGASTAHENGHANGHANGAAETNGLKRRH